MPSRPHAHDSTRHRRPRRGLSVSAAALLVLLAGATTGCFDLFKPATPEPPAETGGTVEVSRDYSDPEAVLTTVAAAVQAKGRGNATAAYMGAFADSAADGVPLVVEFDPNVASQWDARLGSLPTWTRTLEQQFYAYLTGLTPDDYVLQWERYDGAPSDDNDPTASVATLYRQYRVYAIMEDGTDVSVAHGRADLTFQRTREDEWVIRRWVDRADPAVGHDPADAGLRSFSRLRLDSTGL